MLFFCCQISLQQPNRKARPFPWQHDLFEDSIRAAGIQGIEDGTKLYVSNLDRGVTNEDIRVQVIPFTFLLITASLSTLLKFSLNLIWNSGTFF